VILSVTTSCIVCSSLHHKEFLYEQPAFLEVEYLQACFTQEVAYNCAHRTAQGLHEQTAEAIEQL
jgi:hypothetical protein